MKAKYPVWIYVKFIISASKYVKDILLSSAYMIRWRHEYVNVIKPNILLSKNSFNLLKIGIVMMMIKNVSAIKPVEVIRYENGFIISVL